MAASLKAYGAVVWRGAADAPEVALVHRPAYGDWSLPKGKPLAHEHPWRTAVREVAEETGAQVALSRRLRDISYPVDGARKRVRYWAARLVDEGSFVAGAEVDEVRWLPVAKAGALLTHHGDRSVLRHLGTPLDTTAVLLVRHGRAGDPEAWSGDDRARPLDEVGQQQAAAVREVLPAFAPGRIVSADLVRCVDTVRPLAEALGLPVETDPLFSEDVYWESRKQARERLLDLAAGGVPVVIGSQGGVIPDLVAALAREPQPVPARKGSVWALHIARRQVVAAEYADRL